MKIKEIHQQEEKMRDLIEQRDNLLKWLIEHPGHADFAKIAADKRHLEVKIATCEYKISNLENDLPLLGDELEIRQTKINENKL